MRCCVTFAGLFSESVLISFVFSSSSGQNEARIRVRVHCQYRIFELPGSIAKTEYSLVNPWCVDSGKSGLLISPLLSYAQSSLSFLFAALIVPFCYDPVAKYLTI